LMGMHHIEEPDLPAAITHPGAIIGGDGMPYVDSDEKLINRGRWPRQAARPRTASIQGEKIDTPLRPVHDLLGRSTSFVWYGIARPGQGKDRHGVMQNGNEITARVGALRLPCRRLHRRQPGHEGAGGGGGAGNL